MIARLFLLLALALLPAILPGCCCSRDSCRPKPVLSGIQMLAPDVATGELIANVTIKVTNRAPVDLHIRAVRASVLFAGQPLAPIQWNLPQPLAFPSRSDSHVTFPVRIPAATALAIVQQSSGAAKLPYRVWGEADATALGSQMNREPFDERGEVERAMLVNSLRQLQPWVVIP